MSAEVAAAEMAATREFKPEWLPSLVTLALLPLLIGLGFWQLDRWDEKKADAALFAASGEAVEFGALAGPPRSYQTVRVRGAYDTDRQFLIDNITFNGRVGYYVVTPFATNDGRWLLVNRGWTVADPARQTLPDVAVGTEERELLGRAGRLPAAGIELGESEVDERWPSVRQFPDIAELAGALDVSLEPWVLLLDPAAEAGYERAWTPPGLPPSRHLGYAVQWFALAATLAVLWFLFSYRKRQDEEQ